ncbi:MAG: VanZ family protein [Crocinitomicaceae bacterium]|nr:VanZ family protein [Crocinitomicaceae bacterium]
MFSFILPALAWTLVVTLLSLLPGSNFSEQTILPHFDKAIHLIMYLFMTHLWMVGLKKQMLYPKIKRKAHSIAFFGVFLFSAVMELAQHFFVADRYFDFLDLTANFFGCIFGIVIFELIYKGSYT